MAQGIVHNAAASALPSNKSVLDKVYDAGLWDHYIIRLIFNILANHSKIAHTFEFISCEQLCRLGTGRTRRGVECASVVACQCVLLLLQ